MNKRFVYFICLVAAMGGLLFGYDWVVIGGAKPFYEVYFGIADSPTMQGLAMSVALLMRLHPAVGLVCTDARCLLGKRLLPRTFFQRAKPERGMVFAQLMLRQWVVMSSAMVRRTVLDAIKEEGGWFDGALRVCEEADVFYRMARIAPCDYVAAPLTIWRVHGNNATLRHFDLFAQETRLIIQKLCRLFPEWMQQHEAVLTTLKRRATVQQALALWRTGQGCAARRCLRPLNGKKVFAIRLCTYLPPRCFDWLAWLYWRWR